jgi:3-oxoacyl-[acyl-carrier protein] reductase
MSGVSNKTTIVVGPSRGLGRGIADALADAGAPVVAVARTWSGSSAGRRS